MSNKMMCPHHAPWENLGIKYAESCLTCDNFKRNTEDVNSAIGDCEIHNVAVKNYWTCAHWMWT